MHHSFFLPPQCITVSLFPPHRITVSFFNATVHHSFFLLPQVITVFFYRLSASQYLFLPSRRITVSLFNATVHHSFFYRHSAPFSQLSPLNDNQRAKRGGHEAGHHVSLVCRRPAGEVSVSTERLPNIKVESDFDWTSVSRLLHWSLLYWVSEKRVTWPPEIGLKEILYCFIELSCYSG